MNKVFCGCDSKKTYVIEKELGQGGQGTVYLVKDSNNSELYAAKWYKPVANNEAQRRQIEALVEKGSPQVDDTGIHFIWPIECLGHAESDGFGYLMPLIDTERYHSLDSITNGKIKQPKLPVLACISRRVCSALEAIHVQGMAYCDINKGNIMINPESGEIVICDNDNVVVNNSDTPVRGVWEFMAPEVALGKAQPNAQSDLYSTAVLLYYLWVWEHPMEGQETLQIKCWDVPAKKKYFAEIPVFMFHPTNQANKAREVEGLGTAVARWDRLCSPRLQKMFTDSFVDGVHNPNRRVMLPDWQRLFYELEANKIISTSGAVNLWDGVVKPFKCWKSQQDISLGLALRFKHGYAGETVLLAHAGAELRRHHINVSRFDGDSVTVIGKIEAHPKEAHHVIIRNLSNNSWSYVAEDKLFHIEPKQARALMPGVVLTIENKIVEVYLA